MRALTVLDDAWRAHDMLEDESDVQAFRVHWVSGIALARIVGHVLDKVDAKISPAHEKAIANAWASWKANREENAIFWDFIEDERNQVLKQYEVGFFEGPAKLLAEDQVFELGECLFCPLTDGLFAGEDCRDVLAMALEWWGRQLHEIEHNMLTVRDA